MKTPTITESAPLIYGRCLAHSIAAAQRRERIRRGLLFLGRVALLAMAAAVFTFLVVGAVALVLIPLFA